jgi:hypothetical protein
VQLTQQERDLLDTACAAVPPPSTPPAIGTDADYPDYVTNLMLTVLDLQLHNVIVSNAITYYRVNRWAEVRSLEDLDATLARFPDDRDGNQAAAAYLWRYLYGDRLGRLRGLAAWARRRGLVDQESLKAWAYASDYWRDFAGQVKGLGPAAYCWLVIRLGVDTVKPDSWVHAFVRRAVGRDLEDMDLVTEVCAAARRVGRQARELDGGIWESERGGPGTI